MSLKKRYGTNQQKEDEGIVVQLGINDDGSKILFKLRRLWRYNKSYTKAITELTEEFNGIDLSMLPENKASEIMTTAFIRGIMVDWDNVLLSDVTGNSKDKGFAPFNEENAKALFANCRGLYDDLMEQASKTANFKDADLKAKAKN